MLVKFPDFFSLHCNNKNNKIKFNGNYEDGNLIKFSAMWEKYSQIHENLFPQEEKKRGGG